MNGIINFETFLITSIILNITPGNDTIFILTKSIAQGKKGGIISALGITTGSIIHTVLAALGLSIIIAKSIIIFNIIKYAGAIYLIYMGYKMLTEKSKLDTDNVIRSNDINYFKTFRDATVTNFLNPKVALFFISFLPQFINPDDKNTVIPFLLLGSTFIISGLIWCLILVFFSSSIFSKLKHNKKMSYYINKFCGLALVGLGIKVAFNKPN